LPHNSKTLTWQKFLEIVQAYKGASATISLDFDLITELTCTHHQFTKPLLRKRGSLYVDEVECPYCKKEGKRGVHALMGEHFTHQIDLDTAPELLQKTLLETGIPLSQIFEVKTFNNGSLKYGYYEISGDKDLIF